MLLKHFLKRTATRWGLSESQLKWAMNAYRKNIIGYGALAKMLSSIANKNITGNQVRKFSKRIRKFVDWVA